MKGSDTVSGLEETSFKDPRLPEEEEECEEEL